MTIQAEIESFQKLSTVARVSLGQSPDSRTCNERGEGVPFLQGNAEFGECHPTHRLYCNTPNRVCEKGDILLSVRAPVGATNQANRRYAIGRGLAAIRFNESDRVYGWHALRHSVPQLQLLAQGSTFEAVSRKDIEDLSVWFPDEVSRKAIARILDNVECVIHQTEDLLAKRERIKVGFVHDLLSRGLDSHGRIRNASTHEFKKTEIGEVPSDWDVVTVESLVSPKSPICYGIVQVGPHTHGGVPTIAIHDLSDIQVLKLHCTDPARESRFSRSRCRAGDLLISIKASTGRIGIAPDGFSGNISRDMARVRLSSSECPQFFKYQLQSAAGQARLDAITVGTTRKELSIIPLRGLLLARPKPEEQRLIADKIEQLESEIVATQLSMAKLYRLRNGLMHDLLTGNVSVTPLLSNQSGL
jgi:type I restriction enzyme, S subunit